MSHNLPNNPNSQRGKGIVPRGVHSLERGRPILSFGDIICAKCSAAPCDFDDSALYTDTQPGGGVLMIRASHHGATADLAMNFDAARQFKAQPWRGRRPIMVFEDEGRMLVQVEVKTLDGGTRLQQEHVGVPGTVLSPGESVKSITFGEGRASMEDVQTTLNPMLKEPPTIGV